MALCSIEFAAKALHKSTSLRMIVPELQNLEPPFPVLYLLHGLSHDCASWLRNTNLYTYAANLPMIIVMPEGQRHFYCNDPRPDGSAYEDHIIEDVIPFIDRTFPTIAHRAGRGIAGMSMGGYGAMMLALRHPDLFSTVCPLAPAIFFAHDLTCPGPAGVQAFAAALPAGKYDCFKLAEQFAANPEPPTPLAIRIGCGEDDNFLPLNRAYHDHLHTLGIEHEFHITAGGHNSQYLDANLSATLAFAMQHLETNAQPTSSAPTT